MRDSSDARLLLAGRYALFTLAIEREAIVMTAHDLFQRMAGVEYVPKLDGVHAVYHFDVQGSGAWTVTVDNGKPSVAQGHVGQPDLELSCDEEDLLELVRGHRATVLIMQGRIAVRGSFERLLQLRPLFWATPLDGVQEAAHP
jgi:predicted lipid carrier protein YhbT